MRRGWLIIGVLALAACGYSKEVVQLHLNPGDPSQSTVVIGGKTVNVTSTSNLVPVTGLGPSVHDVETNPSLAAFLTTRLEMLIVAKTGAVADCSVAQVSVEVRNHLSKGTIATNLTLACTSSGPHGSLSKTYIGRDVRDVNAGFKGVSLQDNLQPGLEACLQQIAQGLKEDVFKVGTGI